MITGNPFVHRGPIRDPEFFYGRREETHRAFDLLRSTQSVSIVGPRRMGKTSLLFHLANPIIHQQYGLAPERHCFVYIDGQSWGSLDRQDLYGLLLQEMQAALSKANLGIDLAVPNMAATPYRLFEQAIRTVVDHQIQPIFLLDEFEAISGNPHLDADFFSSLRSLATRHGVAYVTVSREMLLNLTYFQTSVLSSPFFNFFAQIRLRPFTWDEAEELFVDMAAKGGISFSPTTLDFLLDLAGPHPLLLQLAAYHAFHLKVNRTDPLDEATYAQIRRRFLAEAESHWHYAWRHLSAEDQKHLALLPLVSDPQVIRRLRDAGLVLRHGKEIVPLSPAFRAFVSQQSIPGVLQAPPVVMDLDQRQALLGDAPLALSPLEFDLLTCLVQHAGQVVPHAELESQAWPDTYIEDPDRLKTAIRSLRRTLGDEARCIQNVRGAGYKFAPVPPAGPAMEKQRERRNGGS